jgi:hypothetical protein
MNKKKISRFGTFLGPYGSGGISAGFPLFFFLSFECIVGLTFGYVLRKER